MSTSDRAEKLAQASALDACIADAIKTCARAIGIAVIEGRSCCLHCVHFNEGAELCELAQPPQRPPAKVITFGCPAFDPAVPF